MRIPSGTRSLLQLAAAETAAPASKTTTAAGSASTASAASAGGNSPLPPLPPDRGGSRRFLFTMLKSRDELPKDATLIGYHGTSKANMDGIKQRGFDSSLSGASSGKSLGDGLYGSNRRGVAAFFAARAGHQYLGQAKSEGTLPQVMEIHAKPSEQRVEARIGSWEKRRNTLQDAMKLDPHQVISERNNGTEIFLITPKGLKDPAVEYFGVHDPASAVNIEQFISSGFIPSSDKQK